MHSDLVLSSLSHQLPFNMNEEVVCLCVCVCAEQDKKTWVLSAKEEKAFFLLYLSSLVFISPPARHTYLVILFLYILL